MALTTNEILELLEARGHAQYGREAVSQLEHALQCAHLAEQHNESPETIVAALLHDLGHLLAPNKDDAAASQQQRDDLHQFVALPFLRGVLPESVLEPIRMHVDAKRYLCAVESGYWDSLSPASKRSLELQGGKFSESEASAFIVQPFADEAARLRRYDDWAKVPQRVTPPLSHYQAMVEAVATS